MSARRDFLKNTALMSAALAVKPLIDLDFAHDEKAVRPIVLSTCDFGLKANEAAWNVLKSDGRALDAVETGVKVTKADPGERSVGYGGRPDRDGRVTLDACIMDDFANIEHGGTTSEIDLLQKVIHSAAITDNTQVTNCLEIKRLKKMVKLDN